MYRYTVEELIVLQDKRILLSKASSVNSNG